MKRLETRICQARHQSQPTEAKEERDVLLRLLIDVTLSTHHHHRVLLPGNLPQPALQTLRPPLAPLQLLLELPQLLLPPLHRRRLLARRWNRVDGELDELAVLLCDLGDEAGDVGGGSGEGGFERVDAVSGRGTKEEDLAGMDIEDLGDPKHGSYVIEEARHKSAGKWTAEARDVQIDLVGLLAKLQIGRAHV